MTADFEGLSDAHIIALEFFIFPLHVLHNGEIFFVRGMAAMLIVLRYSRMGPVSATDRFEVLFPSGLIGSHCLAYVNRVIGACAVISVDPLLFFLWWFGAVAAA